LNTDWTTNSTEGDQRNSNLNAAERMIILAGFLFYAPVRDFRSIWRTLTTEENKVKNALIDSANGYGHFETMECVHHLQATGIHAEAKSKSDAISFAYPPAHCHLR